MWETENVNKSTEGKQLQTPSASPASRGSPAIPGFTGRESFKTQKVSRDLPEIATLCLTR